MIFFNRKRTIIDSGTAKDPSKYWYVEKYVYGVLKETVEIPLKTSVKFEAIESGYDDDTFYGWSASGTSTTRTFNNTSSYSNTSAAVKSRLDSENTLKIYGVYRYPYTGKSFSAARIRGSSSSSCIGLNGNSTNILTVRGNGTLTVSANAYEKRVFVLSSGATTSDVTTAETIDISIYDSDGKTKKGTITDKGTFDVVEGDIIKCYIDTTYETPSSSSGAPSGTYTQITFINFAFSCDADMSNANITKYRVESHTA